MACGNYKRIFTAKGVKSKSKYLYILMSLMLVSCTGILEKR